MTREVTVHITASDELTHTIAEWGYVLEPDKHVPMAREIEREWAGGFGPLTLVKGGRDPAKDRQQFLYQFVLGLLKDGRSDDATRYASAMATCWVDSAISDWRVTWDQITGANIRLQKKSNGNLAFEMDTIRPDDGPVVQH
jgi:hypothetical protein